MPEPDERPSDRAIYIGRTGRGKSTTIRYYFGLVRGQRICIDVNDNESFVDDEGRPIAPVRDVGKIDWKQRTIHYVPRDPADQAEFERLFVELFRRRDITVWLDECYGPTTASSCPKHLNLMLTQGRKRNQRLMAATQRPVHIQRNLIAQADHIIVCPGLSLKDAEWIASDIGVTRDEMMGYLDEVARNPQTYGEYGYIHYERRRHHVHFRQGVPVGR